MRNTYQISIILSCLVILLFVNRIKDSERPLAKKLFHLLACSSIVVISSMSAIMVSNPNLAMLLQGIHNASSDFMMIFLLILIQEYTGYADTKRGADEKKKKMSENMLKGCFILAVLDGMNLLLNVKLHHMFSVSQLKDSMFGSVNVFEAVGLHYQFHMFYVYFLAIHCIWLLISKIWHTSKFYRAQYILPLCLILFAGVTDFLNTIFRVPLDFSLFAYFILAIVFCWYPLYYIPRTLTNKMLVLAAQNMKAGMMCYDENDECIFVNNIVREAYDSSLTLSDISNIFMEWIDCTDIKSFDKEFHEIELSMDDKVGYFDISKTVLKDEDGAYLGSFFMINDRTEEHIKHEQDRYLATHDVLTGVYNRDYFYKRAKLVIEDHPDIRYYMVYSNMKDFKLLNQLFGVAKGDEVLKSIANGIKIFATEQSVYGRLSNDHFALLMPRDEFDEMRITKFMKETNNRLALESYHVHMHVGVYEIDDPTIAVRTMCDRANLALSRIKDSYETCISYYTNDMMKETIEQNKMVSEFEQALSGGQFEFFLQPQVDDAGNIHGSEALVRWRHPEQGLIPPGKFIPLFERVGLIYRLDCYIWELACKKLLDWKKRGLKEYYISVNISPNDFYYLDIYKIFTELVELYEVDPGLLHLEITETALMSDFDKQLSLIKRLRDYGFCVAIDDFGSGYSSLNLLKDISADVLKIDMLFLRETEHIAKSRIILQNVISMAHELAMHVVVEGVETKEQLEFLTKLACECYQGYYFSKPVEVEYFENTYFKNAG